MSSGTTSWNNNSNQFNNLYLGLGNAGSLTGSGTASTGTLNSFTTDSAKYFSGDQLIIK